MTLCHLHSRRRAVVRRTHFSWFVRRSTDGAVYSWRNRTWGPISLTPRMWAACAHRTVGLCCWQVWEIKSRDETDRQTSNGGTTWTNAEPEISIFIDNERLIKDSVIDMYVCQQQTHTAAPNVAACCRLLLDVYVYITLIRVWIETLHNT